MEVVHEAATMGEALVVGPEVEAVKMAAMEETLEMAA